MTERPGDPGHRHRRSAVGDRLRARDGTEMTVTRIDTGFLGRPEMLAFVEDTDGAVVQDAGAG